LVTGDERVSERANERTEEQEEQEEQEEGGKANHRSCSPFVGSSGVDGPPCVDFKTSKTTTTLIIN
jgi:hypothetical protein